MYIYQAGALTYHHKNNQFYKATDWRNKLSEFCVDNHIKYFNPAKTFQIEQNHLYNSKMCVDQNRYYLNKSNILVADMNYISESPGTQWELCYASEVKRIPIIAFGTTNWSPHINYGISNYCDDIEDVIELLTTMFSQCIK